MFITFPMLWVVIGYQKSNINYEFKLKLVTIYGLKFTIKVL